MAIKVLFFAEIAGTTGLDFLDLQEVPVDTASLITLLESKFAGLKEKRYAISINREIAHNTVVLQAGDEIALLPPFSGG